MDTFQTVCIVVILCFLALVFLRLLRKPIAIAMKLLLNIALGFISLIIINILGSFIGISIGINWLNALVVGIFGVPGAALLLILQWLLLI